MQLIDVAGRAAIARGVENADFEMAAKFPSIALVKYKDGGIRDETRTETGTVGMANEGEREGTRPGPREASCRGCRGRMHRNYANCGSVLARFGPHRPRKGVMTSGGGPARPPPVARDDRPGGEIPGTFTCVHGRTVCSADALDYLRFTPRRFEWIASDAPCRRRMLRANGRAANPCRRGS